MSTAGSTMPIAALHASDGQNHFLQEVSPYTGKVFGGGKMGSAGVDHDVIVFDREGLDDHPVVLCLGLRPFAVQEYLSAAEARTLAHALLMAAAHAEDTADRKHTGEFLLSERETDLCYVGGA